MAREEKRTYAITPTGKGFDRKLQKFDGWYERSGKMILYSAPGYHYKNLDLDGELIDELINDWTENEGSRDGIDKDPFPLTAARQAKYTFRATGPYQLAFVPRNKASTLWQGDIVVDPDTLQPRTMNSTFAYKLPMAVKVISVFRSTRLVTASTMRRLSTISGSR